MSKELFNQVFEELGGSANYEEFLNYRVCESEMKDELELVSKGLDEISEFLNQLLEKKDRSERLFLALTPSLEIGAACVMQDYCYLVSINIGTIIRIRLLAHILLEVDSGTERLFNSDDKEWILWVYGYKQDRASASGITRIECKDESMRALGMASFIIRDRLGKSLVSPYGVMSVVLSAVDFIIIHELNHVVLGHLAYLESHLNQNEENVKYSIFGDASVVQAMEASADYFAGFRAGKGIRDHILFSMSIPSKLDDKEHTKLMSFSIKLCFSVMAFETTFDMQEVSVIGSYPHPEIRHALFFHGVKCGVDVIDGMGSGSPDEDWFGGVAIGYWAITSAFERLGISAPIELSLSQGMQAHYEVMAASDEVHNEIERAIRSILNTIDLTKDYSIPILNGIEYHSHQFVLSAAQQVDNTGSNLHESV